MRLYIGPDVFSYSFLLAGAGASCLLLGPPGLNCSVFFLLLRIFSGYLDQTQQHFSIAWRPANCICIFLFLIHHGGYHYIFNDSLTS